MMHYFIRSDTVHSLCLFVVFSCDVICPYPCPSVIIVYLCMHIDKPYTLAIATLFSKSNLLGHYQL